ncbi:MAG: hypothetical protein AMJ78_02325 [Omnitrophica WOR_2 bacterium SM23_29]|nr:MAG: hypothetical protein AMJ78_02325 [Omnitrophica WOR_2 bacterium SM23_29]
MKIFFIFSTIVLFVIYILSTKEEKKIRKKYELKGKVEEYWSGKNRRKVERIEKMLDVKYKLLKSPKVKSDTRSKNISEEGICILAYEILPKDSTLELEIAIPTQKEPIHTKGSVAWSEEAGQVDAAKRRSFLTGIKFIEIDNKDKINLVNFINAT